MSRSPIESFLHFFFPYQALHKVKDLSNWPLEVFYLLISGLSKSSYYISFIIGIFVLRMYLSTIIKPFLDMFKAEFVIKSSNGLNTILSNFERTQTCSSICDRTRTSHFWLQTNKHQTSHLIGISLDLLNYSSNWLKLSIFRTLNGPERVLMVIQLFLALNDRTLNLEHSSTITKKFYP